MSKEIHLCGFSPKRLTVCGLEPQTVKATYQINMATCAKCLKRMPKSCKICGAKLDNGACPAGGDWHPQDGRSPPE